MIKIKIILFFSFLFLGFGVSQAYDDIYEVNAYNLGLIYSPAYSNFNILDFTVLESGSKVLLQYVVESCNNTNDVYLEILGVPGEVPCESSPGSESRLNSRIYENMEAGTYEVNLGFGNGNYDYVYIGDVQAQIYFPDVSDQGDTGSGSIVSSGDNTIFGNINNYFRDDFTIRDLLIIEIGLYLFLLIFLFIVKACYLLIKYFKKLRKKSSGGIR